MEFKKKKIKRDEKKNLKAVDDKHQTKSSKCFNSKIKRNKLKKKRFTISS